MRLKAGLTKEEQQEWHRVFAWSPVRVAAGEARWLEYVERRLIRKLNQPYLHLYIEWYEYRAIQKGSVR